MKLRWRIAQFFEKNWWRWYLSGKQEDAYLTWKRHYWQQFLQTAAVTTAPGERILEVGSGPSGIFMMFPNNEVTAVEPLISAYRQQVRHLREGSFPNVRFVESAFERFPITRPFDKIFCLNVINHVGELDACFEKLGRAAANGGTLYLTVDAHNHRFLRLIFSLLPGDILHPHQLELDAYLSRVKGAGYQLSQVSLLKKGWVFNYFLIIAKK